jgi:hypothetical protein
MSLQTRLDGRSTDNSKLTLVNKQGEVLATFTATKNLCDLAIATVEGLHIEKPNGFSSKKE